MEYKYDLAISLLDEDSQLGWDIVKGLGQLEKVFFYKKDVSELTFKNGINTFSDIFAQKSRFVLVLYRENYGNTDWTAVEHSVIQERFKKTIKSANCPILFCKLDKSENPIWLPETYIYHFIDELDELIKILRERLIELGGIGYPQTAEEKLRLNLENKEYEKSFQTRSLENFELANEARVEAGNLKQILFERLIELSKNFNLPLNDKTKPFHANIPIVILHIDIDSVSLYLRHYQEAVNSIEKAYLEILIYKGNNRMKIYKKKFFITKENIYGWRDESKKNFLSTEGLVETIYHDLLNVLSAENSK